MSNYIDSIIDTGAKVPSSYVSENPLGAAALIVYDAVIAAAVVTNPVLTIGVIATGIIALSNSSDK